MTAREDPYGSAVDMDMTPRKPACVPTEMEDTPVSAVALESPPASLPRKKPAAKQDRPASAAALLEEVSNAAAKSRLNRLFKPKANGELKVPKELAEKWATESGKKEITAEFAKSSYDKDSCKGL